MLNQVRLAFPKHPDGERNMERPGKTDYSKKPAMVGRDIGEHADPGVDQQRENAVNRKEIGRERNPEVALVCNDIAAVPGDLELAHPAAHEPDPEQVGELMAEYVNEHWPWKPEKSDQPEQCAEREEPKFFRKPKGVMDSRRKAAEECASQYPGDREQKQRDDLFEPTCRDYPFVVVPRLASASAGATARQVFGVWGLASVGSFQLCISRSP